jgi:hypothetical protein
MDSELFTEDYYIQPDEKVVNFVEEIYKWKSQNLTMYPTDVLNLLIETGNVSLVDVLTIFKKAEKKPVDIKLPFNYIG